MGDFIATQMRDDNTLDYSGSDDTGEKGIELGFMYFRSQVDVIADGLDVRQAERDIRKKEKLREILSCGLNQADGVPFTEMRKTGRVLFLRLKFHTCITFSTLPGAESCSIIYVHHLFSSLSLLFISWEMSFSAMLSNTTCMLYYKYLCRCLLHFWTVSYRKAETFKVILFCKPSTFHSAWHILVAWKKGMKKVQKEEWEGGKEREREDKKLHVH